MKLAHLPEFDTTIGRSVRTKAANIIVGEEINYKGKVLMIEAASFGGEKVSVMTNAGELKFNKDDEVQVRPAPKTTPPPVQ